MADGGLEIVGNGKRRRPVINRLQKSAAAVAEQR